MAHTTTSKSEQGKEHRRAIGSAAMIGNSTPTALVPWATLQSPRRDETSRTVTLPSSAFFCHGLPASFHVAASLTMAQKTITFALPHGPLKVIDGQPSCALVNRLCQELSKLAKCMEEMNERR
jgi:hypothetical protein